MLIFIHVRTSVYSRRASSIQRACVRTCVTSGERAEALGATARGFPAIGDVLGVVGNGRNALFPHYVQNRPTNASKTLSRSFTGGYLYNGGYRVSVNTSLCFKVYLYSTLFSDNTKLCILQSIYVMMFYHIGGLRLWNIDR